MHSPATANKHHISPNNVITPSENTEYNDKPHLRSHGKTLVRTKKSPYTHNLGKSE
jgi:hypothetical protein